MNRYRVTDGADVLESADHPSNAAAVEWMTELHQTSHAVMKAKEPCLQREDGGIWTSLIKHGRML